MKIRILITGANGQLGKAIQEASSDYKEFIEFIYTNKTQLDITKSDNIKSFFSRNMFDYCINCAAYTNVDLAEKEPEKAIEINASAVKKLALYCNQNHVTLIHISTDYVFDGTSLSPYTENDKTNPLNVYGKSKLLGEIYIKEQLSNYFIVRSSWLYSKHNKNFVKTIFNRLLENQKLNIITSQKGTPTSCDDLARFLLYLVENEIKNYGIYNFSASGETSWYGLAMHIAKHLKKNTNIKAIEDYDSPAKRPLYSVFNIDKAEMVLQKKLTTWQQGVNRVLEDLLSESESKILE